MISTLWRAVKLLLPLRGWLAVYLFASFILSGLEALPIGLFYAGLEFLNPTPGTGPMGMLAGGKTKGVFFTTVSDTLHGWFGNGDSFVYGLCTVIFVVLLVKSLFDVVTSYLEGWISERLSVDARVRLMSHVLKLDQTFFDKRSIADLTTRIGGDTGMLRKTVKLTLEMLQTPFLIIIFTIMAISIDWKLFLIGAICMPALVASVVKITKKLYKYYTKSREQATNLDQVMFQCLDGIRTIHAYGASEAEAKNFEKISMKIFRLSMKAIVQRAIQRPIAEVCFGIGGMVVLIFAMQRVRTGEMSFNDFLTFIGAVSMLYKPIRSFLSTIGELASFLPSAERAFELFDEKSKIQDKPDAAACPGLTKEIVFENVSFDYGRGWVFQNLNLTVKRGERIGIVGRTGVGKSTLLALLMRCYDPNVGGVKIDGVDLRDVKLATLRDRIALVSQKPYHFHTTIAENILYGKPGASQAEIEAAAKAAFIHDEIMKMPEGYETVVGHSAVTLSGGQQQRVAVARAILRNAPILLLDEATSALDSSSEAKVQEALDELCKGRTSFIVAHRLGTIRSADRIVVFGEEGQIEAIGPHEQLLETSPTYRRMWGQQQGGAESKAA
jgi:subfamily B ATP-binding cassette protein MsbA